MKFTLTFKTPGVLDQLLDEVDDSCTEEELDEYYSKKAEVEKICTKFLKWNEYISIEFDSDAMTATVQ